MSIAVENKILCRACKGRCCKNNPGIYAGGEVKNFRDKIGKDLVIVVDMILRPEMAAIYIPQWNDLSEDLHNYTEQTHKLLSSSGLVDLTTNNLCDYVLALRPIGDNDSCAITGVKFIKLGQSLCNKCSLLKDDGCSLLLPDRPYQCRVLEPKMNFVCGSDEDTYGGLGVDLLKSWIPYQIEMRDCFIEYVSRMSHEEVKKALHNDDSVFGSMLEEQFLGMHLVKDGTIEF